MAVELCCGALQHPEGVAAPAAQHDTAASSAPSHQDSLLPLGPVPHMIRHAFVMTCDVVPCMLHLEAGGVRSSQIYSQHQKRTASRTQQKIQ